MNVKKNLLMGLVGLSLHAGAAQAQAPAADGDTNHRAWAGTTEPRDVFGDGVRNLWTLILGLTSPPEPRGMAICKDTHSQDLCRVGLANGDFEDPNNPGLMNGWELRAGDHSPAPYLGKTPDSRVLAMPGQGAFAVTGAVLPKGSTSPAEPEHTYMLRLRARGSGALPAELVVSMAVSGGDASQHLAEVTQSVGWEWTDIELPVDGIVHAEPAALFVGIERTDRNSSTMLQIDDVRIERMPLRGKAGTR